MAKEFNPEDVENLVVESTLEMIEDKWKETLMENDKYATGATIASISKDVRNKVVGIEDESGWYIEFGTEPGTDVPLAELQKWAEAKFGISPQHAMNIAKKVHAKILSEGVTETRMVYLMLEKMVDDGRIARFSG